ncbi:MAG: hypothetical protein HY906_05220 [Deltaproteobacteria bacterium]|nr:hypothetical protein [Deltaproteobacteria bacterium]
MCAGGYHGAAWLCPRDSWCVHSIWEAWTAPPDGTCNETWTQDPSSPEPMGCATDCPTESQCGSSVCCGAHTRCALDDGGTLCCIADWPELWADAGAPDGGLTDSGQPD